MATPSVERNLQAQIDELKSELRALRAEQAEPIQSTRRHLLKNLGLAAAGAVAGTVAAGSPADAATGDELILGQENLANATTIVRGSGTDSVAEFLEEGSPVPPGLGALQAMADGKHVWGLAGLVRSAPSSSPDDLPFGVVGYVRPGLPGVGVGGWGTYGGVFSGGRAQLVLPPGSHDDAIEHHVGELHQMHQALRACVADGTPGTWRTLAGIATAGQLHVIAPTRIYDSRAGEEPIDVEKGVLEDEAERVIDAKHGDAVPFGVNGGTATAALVNLTITDTTSDGGYLALFENGTAWPGNSSVNWDGIGRAAANTTVVALDADGTFKVRASPDGGTDFVIDVLGYWL